MTEKTIIKTPVFEIARLIREKSIASTEVVSAFIERIKEVNPKLNAVVKDRFDMAFEEAKRVDAITEQIDPEDFPPLHGVPCTIKEAFAVEEFPQTSGLVARKNCISSHDAVAVSRLKKAGAIILGVTNVSELCMWMESANRVYGRTNNPYDLKRTVGGSSGGEGAIISAAGSPFGLGSDVGGSIRMPAFFNGIFGHKPSSCLVPNEGQYPCARNEAKHYLTTGILCRHATDLMPLMKIIGTPSVTKEFLWQNPQDVSLRNSKVISVPDNETNSVSKDLMNRQDECATFFHELGCEVKTQPIDLLKKSFFIWSSCMSSADEEEFGVLMGQGKRISFFWQFILWLFRLSPHTLPAIGLAGLERIPLSRRKKEFFVQMVQDLRAEIEKLLGEQGVLLYPSFPSVTPKHNKPILSKFPWVYTAIFNVLGFPVTQVPLGLNEQGLPLGIQVASTWGNDHVTIAAAMALEKQFGGWVMPSIL